MGGGGGRGSGGKGGRRGNIKPVLFLFFYHRLTNE